MRSVRATTDERDRVLPGDERIPQPIDTLTHGVTIRRAPSNVWPWVVQMGAGSRGGWYSYDWLDNGRQPSATRIRARASVHPAIGTIFPALPGVTEGFTLLAIEHERVLTLGWLAPDRTTDVTWRLFRLHWGTSTMQLTAGDRLGPYEIIDPNNAAPCKKLLTLPAGVFVRGMTWSRDGASLILGRYRWSGDIFLAERSSTP